MEGKKQSVTFGEQQDSLGKGEIPKCGRAACSHPAKTDPLHLNTITHLYYCEECKLLIQKWNENLFPKE